MSRTSPTVARFVAIHPIDSAPADLDEAARTVPAASTARSTSRARGLIRRGSWRAVGLIVAIGALALVALASVGDGSKPIPLATVLDGLFAHDDSLTDHLIIRSLRIPRTVVGLLVGLAGAVMQGVARNPLAGPAPSWSRSCWRSLWQRRSVYRSRWATSRSGWPM